jgi:hypothetical protein
VKVTSSFFILLILLFGFSNCDNESPTQPQNKSPQILSLDVFPNILRLSDTAIVICEAIDPDGDTLGYDWITDGRIRIKGYNHSWLYHTYENTRVFYPTQNVNLPQDTLWVQCFARDVKGGSEAGLCFLLSNNEKNNLFKWPPTSFIENKNDCIQPLHLITLMCLH